VSKLFLATRSEVLLHRGLMDWWNALEPGVRQGLLIAAGALAVIAIVMAIQLIASWRASKSAVKLLERHGMEQRRMWETMAEERMRRAFLAERRTAYAHFMHVAADYERSIGESRAGSYEPDSMARHVGHTPESPAGADLPVFDDGEPRRQESPTTARIREELSHAREIVRLLAPSDVRFAADRWYIDLVRADPAGVQRAKNEFLAHARADLGAEDPDRAARRERMAKQVPPPRFPR